MNAADFTIEDVLFAFDKKLACRHVSSQEAFEKHRLETVTGDAFAIGAAQLFTFEKSQRSHDNAFNEAYMARLIEGFTKNGKNDRQLIQEGGDKLVSEYKSEIRRMVADCVKFDDNHGHAGNVHFLIFKEIAATASPYDLHRYPFGKIGKQNLSCEKLCSAIYLNDEEKTQMKGNVVAIVNCLTDKVLVAIQTLRKREIRHDEEQKRVIRK